MKKPTLPKLKKKAWEYFALMRKLQFEAEGKLRCYTCDKPLTIKTTDCQLGHYLSRGGYPGLTFVQNNSRPQCYRCNCHLHGNTIEFRERLINELGLNEVEALEAKRHDQVKLTRSDYEEMIEYYKNAIKEL